MLTVNDQISDPVVLEIQKTFRKRVVLNRIPEHGDLNEHTREDSFQEDKIIRRVEGKLGLTCNILLISKAVYISLLCESRIFLV